MTDLKKCASGARDRCQAAGATASANPSLYSNRKSYRVKHFMQEKRRQTRWMGQATVSGPTSVCERIDRGRFADRLQADGTNAARSGLSDIAKWGSVPESAGASTTAGRILQARLHVFHRHFE